MSAIEVPEEDLEPKIFQEERSKDFPLDVKVLIFVAAVITIAVAIFRPEALLSILSP